MAVAYSESKEHIISLICNDVDIQKENAETVLKCISQSCSNNEKYCSFSSFPDSKPGVMQLMIMINKYNINISELALSAVSFLLGFIPIFGNLLSGAEWLKFSFECIAELSDNEKALLVYLREIVDKETNSVDIDGIYTGFICKENNNEDFNSKEAINSLLDSLADKNLIQIRINKIEVNK